MPGGGVGLDWEVDRITTEKGNTMPEEESTLYERIGGREAVQRLVDDFYRRVCDDSELAPFFGHASMEKLIRMQREFFCAALGGPIAYSGMDLTKAHHGRGIQRAHFGRFVEHLLDLLAEHGVGEKEAAEIIQCISTYEGEITGDSSEDG